MTLVDSAGKTTKYNWITTPPDPKYKGNFAQVINLTGKYDPYSIQRFTGGDVYSGEVTWYSVTPSWNHWPTAQINSSGEMQAFRIVLLIVQYLIITGIIAIRFFMATLLINRRI